VPAVVAVRVGQHEGYDRFVIEFDGAVPSYAVTRQGSPEFTLSPRDELVRLEGTSGVLVRAQMTDWTGYRAATAFHPRYPYLREARLVENFEGVLQWSLGVQGRPCLRVFTLTGPDRLVVDVATN
jgi:hypothetical protein